MKKIMYFLLIILLIVLIAISSYFIYKQLKEENEQESIFNNLSEIIQDDTENRLKDNLESNNYIKIQEFYKEKGFTNEPVRCKECRDKRKAEKMSK